MSPSIRRRLRRATTVIDYERFGDLARRTIVLSNHYAVDSHQPLITTEHLACAFVTSDVRDHLGLVPTVADVGRALTERGFQLGTTTAGIVSGDGMDIRRFSKPVRDLIIDAVAMANAAGEQTVGCEHLLLALLDRPRSVGAAVLIDLGVDRATVVARMRDGHRPNEGPPSDAT